MYRQTIGGTKAIHTRNQVCTKNKPLNKMKPTLPSQTEIKNITDTVQIVECVITDFAKGHKWNIQSSWKKKKKIENHLLS